MSQSLKSYRNKKAERKLSATEIPFMLIPIEDRQVVRKFGLGLQDYWLNCWEADPFGSRYVLMPDADLKSTTQAKYRKQLEALGLFMFEIREQGGDRKLWVLNRHGSRVKSFWRASGKTLDEIKQPLDKTDQDRDKIEQSLDAIEQKLDKIEQSKPETPSQQDFQNSSISPQKHLNNTSLTPQRSNEVFEVVDIPPEKTQTPLGGASATSDGMLEEEPPAATDCASATEREASTQPLASLVDQTGITGEEEKDLGWDFCSGGGKLDNSKLVDEICEFAIAHGCRVEDAEKDEMRTFTPKQLEVVLKTFQSQMAHHSFMHSNSTRRQRFQFALRLGRHWSRD